MDQVSPTAPMVETVTEVGPEVVQPSDMSVVPAIFQTADDDRYPGVFLQLDGTVNGSTDTVSVRFAFSIEQWVELQVRGEDAAHDALMVQELLR